MAIGYDERMCLHRAVRPVSQTPAHPTSGEDAAPDGGADESGKDETVARDAAEADANGAEQTEDTVTDSEANTGDGAMDADQTAVENPEQVGQPHEAAESAESTEAGVSPEAAGEGKDQNPSKQAIPQLDTMNT